MNRWAVYYDVSPFGLSVRKTYPFRWMARVALALVYDGCEVGRYRDVRRRSDAIFAEFQDDLHAGRAPERRRREEFMVDLREKWRLPD